MNIRQPAWQAILLTLILTPLAGCGLEQKSETAPPSLEPTQMDPTPTPHALPTLEPLVKQAELEVSRGPVYSLDWSPDGTRLASTGYKLVIIWDVQSQAELASLAEHTSYVWGVAWAPDGSMFASASRDGTVRLWDSASYQELASLPAGDAFCVDWSPDGTQLVTGTSVGRVAVWDSATGELVQKWQATTLIISVDWSPDGSLIAAGKWNGKIILYDPAGGEEIGFLQGTTARSDVNGLAWSPDGHILAAAQQDGRVRLWDAGNSTRLTTIQSHGGWERGIAWSPDGRLLASGGNDGLLRIWDAATGQLLGMTRAGSSALWSVAWSPDGRSIAVGSGKYDSPDDPGLITIWALPDIGD
jgi:WD40 repeat protein